MKKIIIMALLALLLMVTGCGGGSSSSSKVSKSDIVAQAERLNPEKMMLEVLENEAAAKTKYEGNYYLLVIRPVNIGADRIDYAFQYEYGIHEISLMIPQNELKNIDGDHYYTFCGKITSARPTIMEDVFIADDYVEKIEYPAEELKSIFDKFGGDGGDGRIGWTEGSYPFLISNRLSFDLITDSAEFNELIKGNWNGKHYVDGDKSSFAMEFVKDGEANVSKDGSKIYVWEYKINNKLKFPAKNDDMYEVRKLSDDMLVFYAETVDVVPYWVLYRTSD